MIKFRIYPFLGKTKLYPLNNINIFFLYVLLSLIITYPLVIQLNTSIYGITHDNLGWLTSNFLQLKIWSENLDPENLNYLAFPNGIDQTKSIYMFTHEILNTILLRLIQHPIISYNIYFLIKLVLSGFFMFQLSNHISKNRTISFIIGCCYAFSPYFLNMSKAYGASFITFSLPIVILYILKVTNDIKLKNITLLIISIIILLGENYYYGYFLTVSLFITIPIFLIITFLTDKELTINKLLILKNTIIINKRYSALILASSLIIFLLILYAVFPYFNERAFSLPQARVHSTEWRFYFLPSITNSSMNSSLFFIHQNIMDTIFPHHQFIYRIHELFERTNFLGYFPIIIILITIIIVLTKKHSYLISLHRYKIIFFTLMFLLSIILSFGPDYYLSYPFFKIAPMFRFQSRYFVVVLISWLCILTIILKLLYFYIKPKYRSVFTILLFFMFYIDYGEINANNVLNFYEKMPKAYKYLEKDEEPYAIITANSIVSLAYQTNILGFQAFHGKKMVMTPQIQSPNILLPEVQKFYAKHGVKYVIFIKDYKNIKTPPLQLPHEFHVNQNLLNNPYKKIGYLKLFKKFDDSYIYEFDQTITYNDYEVVFDDDIYLFYPGHFRYDGAKKLCNFFNMNLIVINDFNKNEQIRRLAPSTRMWIGGERSGHMWRWINGANITFFNWSANEPNNHTVPFGGEDKIVMYTDGKWNDAYSGLLLRAVCERKNESRRDLKYLREKYILVDNKMTQKKASEYCDELGGSLLIIDSLIENQKIKYYFDIREEIWIDGNFDTFRNEWILKNINDFTNWAPREPNNDKNNETAIIMRPDGQWNDTNQNGEFNFICEFDSDSSSRK